MGKNWRWALTGLMAAALPALGAGCAGAGRRGEAPPRRGTGEAVMGNVFGAPLGLAGLAVMQPLCLPLDAFIAVPAAAKGDREWKEFVLRCHLGLMSWAYCAGYDAGSYAFRDGPARGPCH